MTKPDELATRKASMRRLVLAKRGRISGEERAAAARTVAGSVSETPEVEAAETVLGFASFGTELPTDDTMAALLAAGKRLLLPFVDGRELRAAEVRSVEDVAPGYRGIREPVARTPVDPALASVVLVPGVAFDETGRRLGYGGGFYDAFLASLDRSIVRVGLCFDLQVVPEVPAGEADERVDAIVTERRVIRCSER